MNYLDFEEPIRLLDNQLSECIELGQKSDIDVTETSAKIKSKLKSTIKDIYSNLSPWQKVQISRHPDRPYTLDYTANMFSSFTEIHGDRMYGDDKAIICGFATLDDKPFMLIGHQKGRDSKEKV